MFARLNIPASLRAFAFGAMLGLPLAFGAGIASSFAADLAQAKSVVDTAKAQGAVGEQGDGYLGFVHGSADAATTAAVTDINAGRADAYRQTAAKTGVTPEAAGQAVAIQLQARIPAGQYFKPVGGSWVQK
jgi:uncharacterized protein YdbL (DUF1318 family)